MPPPQTHILDRLIDALAPCGRLAVLLSGGVDSSLLAAAAARALGADAVLALTCASELLPEEDLAAARAVSAQLGIHHLTVSFQALALPEVAGNTPERCYACKGEMIRLGREAAAKEGFLVLAEGSSTQDTGSHRPGLRAVREAGVISPLAVAGLDKQAVRDLALELKLAVWDKPSTPCLATRFPEGHPLDLAEVGIVHQAERMLRERFGLRQLRLRHQGGQRVRLEVSPAQLTAAVLLEPGISAALEKTLGLRLLLPVRPYGGEERKVPAPVRGARTFA
ncbi:MAG: asparagine synthase-related protein [Pseudomonadota bacterium]